MGHAGEVKLFSSNLVFFIDFMNHIKTIPIKQSNSGLVSNPKYKKIRDR